MNALCPLGGAMIHTSDGIVAERPGISCTALCTASDRMLLRVWSELQDDQASRFGLYILRLHGRFIS
jgi:hypothetical protein